MKTNKRLFGIAVYLICSMGVATAQESANVPATQQPQQEKRLPREVPNPEKIATQMTDQMQKSLQLTDKQYKKIHKIIFKEQKARFKAMQNGSEQHPRRGENGMRGGDGHQYMGGMGSMGGMDGAEAPRMGEGGFGGDRKGGGPRMQRDNVVSETQKKEAEDKEKKFKKILSTEQFDKWKAVEEETSRAKVPRERHSRNNRPVEVEE